MTLRRQQLAALVFVTGAVSCGAWAYSGARAAVAASGSGGIGAVSAGVIELLLVSLPAAAITQWIGRTATGESGAVLRRVHLLFTALLLLLLLGWPWPAYAIGMRTLDAGLLNAVIDYRILWWPTQAFFAMTFVALRIASRP